ncbi:phage/plasmid primase, P4 family [Metabacillus fastidiosus]|uniref:DNA primase family protein n=1 Tax=Metabacillus fastidiosus TaxID=1458 RepID=UPI002E223522|nr:phage/plasmid primase, P4 family [Metabacillus fastidiosus]MED4534843.1 phage/plasmid primase, P4 family [Metabacillus fastidiosus]
MQYKNGVYVRVSNDDIMHTIQKKIGHEATESRKREILSLIKHEHELVPLHKFNDVYQLNLQNGIYDYLVNQFVDHSRGIYSTIQLSVKYDPEAECPRILEFLNDILDEDGVEFVIEWLAYMCLPQTDPDKILFLQGKGGNGKSALLNIIKNFLGITNITNMSLNDLTDDKFARAHLYGKLANICGDIDNRVLENTGILKSLTGSEPIYAQYKGVDGFNFQSFAKLMFSANELPMSKDKTEGYFRRIYILPFEKHLPEEKKVSRTVLDKRLTNQKELSGLLNLVIDKIKKLRANGYKFTIPAAAKRALDEYKYAHDKIEQFIQAECKADQLNNKIRVSVKHFYKSYSDWCSENGVMPESKRKVTENLRNKGYETAKSTGNASYIFGLTISTDSYFYNKREC